MIHYHISVAYTLPVVAFSNPIKKHAAQNYRTAAEIKRAVAKAFSVTVADLESHQRARHFAFARFAAFDLIRREGRLSLPQIRARFGGRDHSTILHGIRRCKELLDTDPEFAWAYEEARG